MQKKHAPVHAPVQNYDDDDDDDDDNDDDDDDENSLDNIRWSWYSSPLCGNQQGHNQECPSDQKDE